MTLRYLFCELKRNAKSRCFSVLFAFSVFVVASHISILVGANDVDLLRYGFKTAEEEGFGIIDLYQDMDGAAIGIRLANESLLDIFDDYYFGEKYLRRANLFYNALNKTGYEGETKYDTLLNLARIYSYNPAGFSTIFGILFGSFNELAWGECLAQGFATKVSSMIDDEDSQN